MKAYNIKVWKDRYVLTLLTCLKGKPVIKRISISKKKAGSKKKAVDWFKKTYLNPPDVRYSHKKRQWYLVEGGRVKKWFKKPVGECEERHDCHTVKLYTGGYVPVTKKKKVGINIEFAAFLKNVGEAEELYDWVTENKGSILISLIQRAKELLGVRWVVPDEIRVSDGLGSPSDCEGNAGKAFFYASAGADAAEEQVTFEGVSDLKDWLAR